MVSISKCRSCGSGRLVSVLNLGEQYLSDFRNDNKKPEKHPLHLIMCQDCDLVQLKHTTPSSSLYNDHYGYYSGISNTIKANLKNITDKALQEIKCDAGDIVLDIGSNDATLLKNYPTIFKRIGFDPVNKFSKYYDQESLVYINDFFSFDKFNDYTKGKRAKIITCISMFYDLDDPNLFVADLEKALAEDGILLIQQNYLVGMLQQNAVDNIVHEHLEYYSISSLSRLLNRHGLDIYKSEINDINGGSFLVFVKHMDTLKKMRLMEQKIRLNNKNTYFLFSLRVKQAINKLYRFVKTESEAGKTFYLYGASTRGNTLIQAAGLDNKMIKCAVERNPLKVGLKIASLSIPIISEEEARKNKPDYMIVLPWFFKEEIVKREKEYLKNGGKLIFPLPYFEILSYENINSNTNNT